MPLGEVSKDAQGKKVIGYPKGGWKKYQEERAGAKDAANWNGNLGIVTGRISDLLVLDLDSYKPGFDHALVQSLKLPVTPCQQTAGGGKQYFFRYPSSLNIRNTVCLGHEGSGIDVRADGGMVIAPPTVTPYGQYEWLVSPEECGGVAEPPQALVALLEAHSSPVGKSKKGLPGLMSLAEGEGRDSAMTAFVGTLLPSRHPDKWPKEVWPAMLEVNRTYKPPLSDSDLKRIYKSITEKELQKRNLAKGVEKPFVSAMSFAELMGTEYPKARYVLEPFFEAGTMNMISAPPNTWKSWLLFLFAGSISLGEPVFGKFPTEASKVLIVNEEDSHRAIQDRFRLLGLAKKPLDVFFRVANGDKLTDDYVDKLVAECQIKGITVVMFDSLRSVHDAEENDSTEMQAVLDKMKKMTRQGITVIFTHHHRKKGPFEKGDSAESSRGSSAINAAISGHLSFDEEQRETGKAIVVRHLKSKAGEKMAPFEIGVVKDGDRMVFKYAGDFKTAERKLVSAKDAILAEMGKGGWWTAKQFMDLEFGGKNVVRLALEVLVKEGIVKVYTRNEAQQLAIDVGSIGKGNEKIYAFNEAGVSMAEEQDELDFAKGL